MSRTQWFRSAICLSLLMFIIALGAGATASAARSAGFPPSFGKPCGQVNGETWKYKGQTGARYNVLARSPSSCGLALRSVSALTRQTPRAGADGPNTLRGPAGFHCVGEGITLDKTQHFGVCRGSHGATFLWSPAAKQ